VQRDLYIGAGWRLKTKEVGVVSPLLISGLRFHPKGGDIRLKSVMIEDGQVY